MRILVTGGCGFIGSNLIRYLLSETEHDVLNLDKLTYAANPQSLSDVADSPRYRFEAIDLADGKSLQASFEQYHPDAVIHLAAESHVDRSIDGPCEFIQSNIVGTYELLQVCLTHYRKLEDPARERFRMLHVSTDEVFGSLGETGSFCEQSAYDPRSPYAATKASSDHLVRAWHATYGLPVIVTHSSNNFGPYQFPEKLIPLMVIRALREESLPVYGQGFNVRDWLYVEDHVQALLTVLQRGQIGQTYNVAARNEQRNLDLVNALCDVLDTIKPRSGNVSYRDLVTFVEDRPGHDYRYSIDCKKIHDELGWQPKHDWNASLRRTVQWYVDNPSWWQAILDGSYRLQRLGHPT